MAADKERVAFNLALTRRIAEDATRYARRSGGEIVIVMVGSATGEHYLCFSAVGDQGLAVLGLMHAGARSLERVSDASSTAPNHIDVAKEGGSS